MEKRDPMEMFGNSKYKGIVIEKQRQYLEQDMVTAVCTYMKLQHPKVLFEVVSPEQRRSFVAQNIFKKQQCLPGAPDFRIKKAVGKWHGLELEFKKDWPELFYKDGRLKPGNQNHFYEQDDYHKRLWAEDIYATFVWDKLAAILLIEKYLRADSLELINYPR